MIEIIIILFVIFSKSGCPNIIKYIFGLIAIFVYIRRKYKLKEHISLNQLRAQANRKLKDKRAIFIRSNKISMDELTKIATKISQKLDISSLIEIEKRISYKSKKGVFNYGFAKKDKCYDNPNTSECKDRELNNVYIVIKTQYADTKLRDDIYANTRNYSKMYRGIIPENNKSLNRKYLHYYFKKYLKILNLENDILVSYG